MDRDDIYKYIGYVVVGFFVFYFAVKSIRFQYKFVEGFVKKTPTEGFVKKRSDENPDENPDENSDENSDENKIY